MKKYLFMLLSYCSVHAQDYIGNYDPPAQDVSLVRLLAVPEKCDGNIVRFFGYAYPRNSELYVFYSREQLNFQDFSNAIRIECLVDHEKWVYEKLEENAIDLKVEEQPVRYGNLAIPIEVVGRVSYDDEVAIWSRQTKIIVSFMKLNKLGLASSSDDI